MFKRIDNPTQEQQRLESVAHAYTRVANRYMHNGNVAMGELFSKLAWDYLIKARASS